MLLFKMNSYSSTLCFIFISSISAYNCSMIKLLNRCWVSNSLFLDLSSFSQLRRDSCSCLRYVNCLAMFISLSDEIVELVWSSETFLRREASLPIAFSILVLIVSLKYFLLSNCSVFSLFILILSSYSAIFVF